MAPELLPLQSIQDALKWYEQNLCRVRLMDPRGFRVRFLPENFVHLIHLKNKYEQEPRNARIAVKAIREGKIHFVQGRFDRQRTAELSWAAEIATTPDRIFGNWQPRGQGDEAYVKNFGTEAEPKYRVTVCKVVGTIRQVVTIFPRERVGSGELQAQIWP
jgi:hypothetical protein